MIRLTMADALETPWLALLRDLHELNARGMPSGGCHEVDLVEHARYVLANGIVRTAVSDMRGEDDSCSASAAKA
jgi:hypothetical protein